MLSLLKNKANIHAGILNHFIGPYDFFWLTDSRVSHVHIIILIYFYMVDWLASQWVSSHCYDLLSGFSWRPGCRLLIAQKNISKFQRFRNRPSTYLKQVNIFTHLTDSRASASVRTCMTRKVAQNDGIVHAFKTCYYTCHKNKIWLTREPVSDDLEYFCFVFIITHVVWCAGYPIDPGYGRNSS